MALNNYLTVYSDPNYGSMSLKLEPADRAAIFSFLLSNFRIFFKCEVLKPPHFWRPTWGQ